MKNSLVKKEKDDEVEIDLLKLLNAILKKAVAAYPVRADPRRCGVCLYQI